MNTVCIARRTSLLCALLVLACSGQPPPSPPRPTPTEQRVPLLGGECVVIDWVLTADCEVSIQDGPARLARGGWIRVHRDGSPHDLPLARPLSLRVGDMDIVFVKRLGLHPSGAVAWGHPAEDLEITTPAGVVRAEALPYDVTIAFYPDGALEWLRLAAPAELQVGDARILAVGHVAFDNAGRVTRTGLGKGATLAGVTFRQNTRVDLEWDESGRLISAREAPRLER